MELEELKEELARLYEEYDKRKADLIAIEGAIQFAELLVKKSEEKNNAATDGLGEVGKTE